MRKIDRELDKFCKQVLDLSEKFLIPSSSKSESKAFFLKLYGDYNRYMSEFHYQNKQYPIDCEQSYQKATEIAEKDLKTTNPIRLGLALNFSVFYYEILRDPYKAVKIAKTAFENAINDIEDL